MGQQARETRCFVIPSTTNQSTVAPNTGVRLRFTLSSACAPNSVQVTVAPFLGRPPRLVYSGPDVTWLASFPEGKYAYTITAASRPWAQPARGVGGLYEGSILSSSIPQLRAVHSGIDGSLQTMLIDGDVGSYTPGKAIATRITLRWESSQTLKAATLSGLLSLVQLKVCPTFGLKLSENPGCHSEAIDLTRDGSATITWILEPTEVGPVEVVLATTLSAEVDGATVLVSRDEVALLGESSRSVWQWMQHIAGFVPKILQSWPGVVSVGGTFAGIGGWWIQRHSRQNRGGVSRRIPPRRRLLRKVPSSLTRRTVAGRRVRRFAVIHADEQEGSFPDQASRRD